MKKLALHQMEDIHGGGWWNCVAGGIALGTAIGFGFSALFGNPVAIAAITTNLHGYISLVSGGTVEMARCIGDD